MSDIESSLKSIEMRVVAARDLAASCLQELRDDEDKDRRYLIAERLPAFGSILIPAITQILSDPTTGQDARYLVAWVGLIVGDRDRSVDVLRREVDADSEWSLPAANALAQHNVTEASAEISNALDRSSLDRDNPNITQYSAALRKLGGSIKPSTRKHITDGNESWIARAIEADFPATLAT